jgi:hypothetical protein
VCTSSQRLPGRWFHCSAARERAALAQERYYSSYGPAPVTAPSTAPAADTSDGIDSLPFVLGLAGALIVGIAAGTGMHLLVVRRRQATGLPA